MARLRNENFFKAAAGDADGSAGKVRRAYQRCAETGTLNLSAQRLTGCLPETVCGFQDASWAENWWEQSPVLKLDISLNALEEIPSSIGNLAECESVLAYSNQLRAVPKELFALPLKQLNLKSNLLAALPRTPLPETLVELVLSENRLTELPEAWPETLEALELASNALQSLRLAGCERLKRLDLSGNALRRLPDLSRKPLRDLQASKNQLQQVSLEGCASLVLLDLSANQLQQLALPSMPSLDSLNVSGNQLKDLDLGPLPNLTVLMAESNKLRAFPAAVPSLVPRLSTLDLSNNDISQVPPELGLVKDLTRLALAGNPICTIRPELLRGGAEALKKFLRSRLADADEGEPVPRGSGACGADLTAELREAKATGQLLLPRRGLTQLPELPGKLKVLDV